MASCVFPDQSADDVLSLWFHMCWFSDKMKLVDYKIIVDLESVVAQLVTISYSTGRSLRWGWPLVRHKARVALVRL
jgi:hypothetical protein